MASRLNRRCRVTGHINRVRARVYRNVGARFAFNIAARADVTVKFGMTDTDLYDLAIEEGIAWHDLNAVHDFIIGYRAAEPHEDIAC